MSRDIYLETTAVLDTAFKSFPEALSILSSSNQKYTSQYAKMEINRGFLNYLILMYNRLEQTPRWSDYQQYIANVAQTPRRYLLGGILDALTAYWKDIEKLRPDELKDKYGDVDMSTIMINSTKSFLRIWIRFFFKKIDKDFTEILNPMNCFPDIKEPQMKKGIFVIEPKKCIDSSVECDIKKYFLDNVEDFRKILDRLKAINKEDLDGETKKRISSLKKIIRKILPHNHKFSNYCQTEILCQHCGDAIHAVIAPETAIVLNRNERHYKPICEAVGKESMTYTSPTYSG